LARSTEAIGAWRRAAALGIVAGALAWPGAATPARAQSLFERLNLDRLRLTAMGASVGAVRPTRMEQAQAYSLHADYGEIAPRVRVIFSATYWGSRYTDDVVRQFEQRLQANIVDPGADDTIRHSRITVSDIALSAELRWGAPTTSTFSVVRPYLGGALTAHVINAEGKLIRDTFVENALDNITAGVGAVAGLDLVPFSRLSVGLQLRYDLLSGLRFGSGRLVATYHFDPARGRGAP
jgi:hypothetical protein